MGNNFGKKMHNYLYTYAALIAVGMLGACNEPTTFVPTATESFVYDNRDYYQQADKLLQADYLIIPDFSYSMKTSKEGLESALQSFANSLQQEGIDYHIGFARGTTQSTGFDVQYLPTDFLGDILTAASGTSVQSLVAEQLAPLAGANAPNEPVILETTKRVIESQKSRFLRQGAQLVYVFISDADDKSHTLINSNRTTSYYVNALRSQKIHPNYINARSFATNTGSCKKDEYSPSSGVRINSVANSLNSAGNSFRCIRHYNSFSDSLQNLARDVSKPVSRFAVQADADPSSIEVRINGGFENPGPNTWTFKASTSEVIFSNPPPASASVEITFDMIMKLSRQPKLSSMVVTINGNQVPQSNGSGWSLDTNTLELRFHGGWQPNHGETVLVSYEVQ